MAVEHEIAGCVEARASEVVHRDVEHGVDAVLALQPRADAEHVEPRAHCEAPRRLGDDGDALARRVDEARGGGERRARRRERPALDVGVLGALQRVDELELVRLARLHVADAEDRRGVVVAVGPQEDRVGQQQQRLGVGV